MQLQSVSCFVKEFFDMKISVGVTTLGPNLQNIVQQIYDIVMTCGRFTTNVW